VKTGGQKVFLLFPGLTTLQ